jgi:Ataxin-3
VEQNKILAWKMNPHESGGSGDGGGAVWVYHEKQESLLCGQHCLNNLLQLPMFTAGDLADIAQLLDQKERQYMLEAGHDTPEALKYLAEDSQNVDVSGNFSIEVLRQALQNVNVDLVPWFPNKKGYSDDDPCNEVGFIVNHASHWFSIRKIGQSWWNLNSFQDRPEPISTFYLSAFLSQLTNDGYFVFVTRGSYFTHENSDPSHDSPHWHCMSSTKASKPQPFQGQGQRLGGASSSSPTDLTEDEQLAMALSLSMESQSAGKSEQELLREKRLSRYV